MPFALLCARASALAWELRSATALALLAVRELTAWTGQRHTRSVYDRVVGEWWVVGFVFGVFRFTRFQDEDHSCRAGVSSPIWRARRFPSARRDLCAIALSGAAMQTILQKCWVFCRRGGLRPFACRGMGPFSRRRVASQRSCANGP